MYNFKAGMAPHLCAKVRDKLHSRHILAGVVEMGYTYALGAYVARLRGSNPLTGTNFLKWT